MRVVLKVWSSNPDENRGCDFAVVELTPELAKLPAPIHPPLKAQISNFRSPLIEITVAPRRFW